MPSPARPIVPGRWLLSRRRSMSLNTPRRQRPTTRDSSRTHEDLVRHEAHTTSSSLRTPPRPAEPSSVETPPHVSPSCPESRQNNPDNQRLSRGSLGQVRLPASYASEQAEVGVVEARRHYAAHQRGLGATGRGALPHPTRHEHLWP